MRCGAILPLFFLLATLETAVAAVADVQVTIVYGTGAKASLHEHAAREFGGYIRQLTGRLPALLPFYTDLWYKYPTLGEVRRLDNEVDRLRQQLLWPAAP